MGAAMVVVAVGCGPQLPPEARSEMEEVLRAGSFPQPPQYPGNGDLTIYYGPSTAIEDCLIYDMVGTSVHQGSADTGPVILQVSGTDIVDPLTNASVCHREGNELVERVIVGGPGGDVLFTVLGKWVFEGDLDFANKSLLQILLDLQDQLLYTFSGTHVYDGSEYDGEILVTTTAPITLASRQRKLVISALIAGECGGLGLPDHPGGWH